ncbi:MAG: hypothetical protein WBQ95_11095 [Terracidiphilus sp.]
MHIITSIYFAEIRGSIRDTREDGLRATADLADLEDKDRQWISVYEGKNRVEPRDGDR